MISMPGRSLYEQPGFFCFFLDYFRDIRRNSRKDVEGLSKLCVVFRSHLNVDGYIPELVG